MELVQELIDHRDQKLVLGCLVVERSIVDAKASQPVRLLDQQH
jgi:hypothetical protein